VTGIYHGQAVKSESEEEEKVKQEEKKVI